MPWGLATLAGEHLRRRFDAGGLLAGQAGRERALRPRPRRRRRGAPARTRSSPSPGACRGGGPSANGTGTRRLREAGWPGRRLGPSWRARSWPPHSSCRARSVPKGPPIRKLRWQPRPDRVLASRDPTDQLPEATSAARLSAPDALAGPKGWSNWPKQIAASASTITARISPPPRRPAPRSRSASRLPPARWSTRRCTGTYRRVARP